MSGNESSADALKDRYRVITDLIESGKYYKDARDWYATVYLAPYSHRFWMLIIALFASLAAFLSYTLVDSMFPLNKSVPFATYIHWKDEYYPKLHKLSDTFENPNAVIARYFLAAYVKDQEEYTPPNFKGGENAGRWRQTRIEHQSKKRVYHNYLNHINPNNTNSPSQRYANHTKREVEIISVKLPQAFKTNDTAAKIRFQATEIRGDDRTSSLWEAFVTFSITDANLALQEKKPLRLYVSDYRVGKVTETSKNKK